MSTYDDATLAMVSTQSYTTPPTEEGGLPNVHTMQWIRVEWTDATGVVRSWEFPNPEAQELTQGSLATITITITPKESST